LCGPDGKTLGQSLGAFSRHNFWPIKSRETLETIDFAFSRKTTKKALQFAFSIKSTIPYRMAAISSSTSSCSSLLEGFQQTLYPKLGLITSFVPFFPNHPSATLENSFSLVLPFYSTSKDTPTLVNAKLGKHWSTTSVNTRIFSNLWAVNLKLPDFDDPSKIETWASSEHYFQCAKYSTGDRNFMKTLTTGQVASFGQRRLPLNKSHISKISALRNQKQQYPQKKDGR
jgi:hypothetical protein